MCGVFVCVSCKHTCVLFFLYKLKQLRFRYINNDIKLLLLSLISKRRTEVIHKHISRQVYKVHFSLYVLLQLHLLPVLKGVAQPGPKRMESGCTLFPFPEVFTVRVKTLCGPLTWGCYRLWCAASNWQIFESSAGEKDTDWMCFKSLSVKNVWPHSVDTVAAWMCENLWWASWWAGWGQDYVHFYLFIWFFLCLCHT